MDIVSDEVVVVRMDGEEEAMGEELFCWGLLGCALDAVGIGAVGRGRIAHTWGGRAHDRP